MSTGCQTLQLPAEGIVRTILPEYVKYVQQDPNLTDAQKKRRILNSDAFSTLVDEGSSAGKAE